MKAGYINGLQVHSNSQDLGYVFNTAISGLEFPEVRLSQYDKPGEHGSVVASHFYGGRTIAINGRISGTTVNEYYLNRRTFTNILRIILNSFLQATPLLFQFTTMDNLNLQCYCYVSQKPQLDEKSLNHASFSIQLFAPDFNLYDQSTQIVSINFPTGGGVQYPVIYPVSYPSKTGGFSLITNNGDSDVFPLVTFTGPLTSPFITNTTLGTSFQVATTLNAGDVLTVDMANKTMVLNGIQNALQFYVLSNTWLSLQPGNNSIQLGSSLSSDTGNAQVSFQNAYVGV